MRFLHVFPSFAVGGRELRAVELMGLIAERGLPVEHEVVALNGMTECAARVASGVSLRIVPAPAATGSLFARVRAIRALLRARRPDLLLTYNWGAIEWLIAARRAGFGAVVHHEDGFGPDESGTRMLRRRVWARRLFLPAARAVVVPSRVLEGIARRTWRQPAARVHYLPNGVDVQRFGSHGPRDDARGIVFVGVGRLSPEKDPCHAIEAFARVRCEPPATLRLVGEGPELARARACAAACRVTARVEFAGAVADTAPEYRRADVFVIPSRTEQMPLVLLEAMASGLPVAGTDVGDVAAIVAEPNRRFIAPRRDVAALARAMEALAADAALRAELGRANRARVEREFERGACYGRYVELYERIARGGG